jgi:hypothetical protein
MGCLAELTYMCLWGDLQYGVTYVTREKMGAKKFSASLSIIAPFQFLPISTIVHFNYSPRKRWKNLEVISGG